MKVLLSLLCPFIGIATAAASDAKRDAGDVPSHDVIGTNENHRQDGTNTIDTTDGNSNRKLWCQNSSSSSSRPSPQWHPVYSAGWTNGYCRYNVDCDSPGYSSELECCKVAYAGQISGYCLSRLPSPPTTSPTGVGGLDVYYPDYSVAWDEGHCINTRPMPSGWPTFSSMLSCCKAAYAGQMSGKCISMLPNPPTVSPTNSARTADFWYPQYEISWDQAGCSNALPLPYKYENDRPKYDSGEACCAAAYGGQVSMACICGLDNPPLGCPGVVEYSVTTTTATISSTLNLGDLIVPYDQAELIQSLESTIAALVQDSLEAGDTVQEVIIISIDGQLVNRRRTMFLRRELSSQIVVQFQVIVKNVCLGTSTCQNRRVSIGSAIRDDVNRGLSNIASVQNALRQSRNTALQVVIVGDIKVSEQVSSTQSTSTTVGPPPTKPPTEHPTVSPTTPPPSTSPSKEPTSSPSVPPPTSNPSTPPPSTSPSKGPTSSPSFPPTSSPTSSPSTPPPSTSPSKAPSSSPSIAPTSSPTASPTINEACIKDDFESGQLNGWEGATVATDTETGGKYLATSNRAGTYVGQKISVPVDCLEANSKYLLSAKVRLVHTQEGGISQCSQGITDLCPLLTLSIKETAETPHNEMQYYSIIDNTPIGTDGEWIEMNTTLDFYWHYPLLDSYFATKLYFQGPEVAVDIHMDDFVIQKIPPLDFGVIPPNQQSEVIDLPDPPEPTADSLLKGSGRTNCPHDQSGLASWHDVNTWGGSIPAAGDDVTLPAGVSVLVDQSIIGTLGTVTVPATSSLIIGENSNGIEINAGGFNVIGSLVAGSETCRIETSIKIVLHGTRPDDRDTNGVSASATVLKKGIAVQGGTLSLHGKRYFHTWSRLAEAVRQGDSTVHTQSPVNWEAGQEVVIVTTAFRDDRAWHQNEVRSIVSVAPDAGGVGSIIELDTPAEYTHLANPSYQGEIGLLSRTIVVQGSDTDSQPETDLDDGQYQSSRENMGTNSAPDPTKNMLGFGGHIIIKDGGFGFVEGVELYKMGQTNFLGRYPMHFHMLVDGCTGCYFRDSSVHKSFYRCVSIHGTNNLLVSENVGYDVLGYCYYLEDGTEHDNEIKYNLGAHIHYLGEAPYGSGQQVTAANVQSTDRILPADSTASAFYITNIQNNIIGNVASGGWAGFAFPTLREAIGLSRSQTFDENNNRVTQFRPSAQLSGIINGNTAHSTGWWWNKAAGFYFGGSLYYNDNDLLVYDAGRSLSSTPKNARERWPCLVNQCETRTCDSWCGEEDWAWNIITHTKVWAVRGSGLNSWSGRLEVLAIETHDVGLSLEALSEGFYVDSLFASCRTGEDLAVPIPGTARWIGGSGFNWYDTGQEHIMTNATFKNCGYRQSESNPYDQYESSPTRGCYNDLYNGCSDSSSTFGLLTHSDQFNPEIMQATSNIAFIDCGRRFKLFYDEDPSTVSGRIQNWLDADGSLIDMSEPLLAGSGLADAASWWNVEDAVIHDSHGPLTFIRKNGGPTRGLGHVNFEWHQATHDQVGVTVCGNGGTPPKPCPYLGYIRHLGTRFDGDNGLPVTANAEVAGPVGGFGWLLSLTDGAPKELIINDIEVLDTPLLISIQYPAGTSLGVTFSYPMSSRAAVYNRDAGCQNAAHHYDSSSGLLTVRVVGTGRYFARAGLTLPRNGGVVKIRADCTSTDGIYCDGAIPSFSSSDLNLCPAGFSQTAYDICCSDTDSSTCQDISDIYAAPATSPTPNSNLISDGDFEGECGGRPWQANGATTVLQIDQSSYSSGSQSLKVMSRPNSWDGVKQDLTGIFLPGSRYRVTLSARMLDVDGRVLPKLNVLLSSTNARTYLGHGTDISTTWTQLVREYTIPSDALQVLFYVETAGGSTADFALDNVQAELVTP